MEDGNVSHTDLYQNINDYYIGDPIQTEYEIRTTTGTVTYPPPKDVKRVTKTIEKYDKKGNLKSRKVIITEEEIVQKQDPITFWQSSYTDNPTFTNSLN